jgi:hypothetical protein
MTDIEPVDGSRSGWSYSTYKRIGACEIVHATPRVRLTMAQGKRRPAEEIRIIATLYGVYGVRGDEILVQFEGERTDDGCTVGRSVLASSMDSDPYLWQLAAHFTDVRIFETPEGVST